MNYSTRYYHKISPKDTDVGPDILLGDNHLKDRKVLGAALRERRIMIKGERINHFRVEKSGKVVIFPCASIWNAIVLEPLIHSDCALVPELGIECGCSKEG